MESPLGTAAPVCHGPGLLPSIWRNLGGATVLRLAIITAVVAFCNLGCKTPDLNPQTARPGFGYVDFFCYANLGGEVIRTVGSRREAYELRGIVRFEEQPGASSYLVRVGSLQLPVGATVVEGQITPVFLNSKILDFASSGSYVAGNYSSRTDFSVTPQILNPIPYAPKERAPYASIIQAEHDRRRLEFRRQ